MTSGITVWISIIVAIVGIVVTFVWQYLGNPELRRNVHAGISYLKVKVLRERFFFTVYIPIFLLAIGVLQYVGLLNLTSGLIAYAVWLSPWSAWVARKKRRVSALAWCAFSDKGAAYGRDGLEHVRHTDGDPKKELFEEHHTLRTDASAGSYYIYFRIRNDVAQQFQGHHCIVLVEFFDEPNTGAFDLEYDSSDKGHPNPHYKPVDRFHYSGSKHWKLAYFNLPDPAFRQRQNANSDFRLRVAPNVKRGVAYPDLRIRKVICLCLPN